ncbi:YfhO family protein [Lactiplantibacillus fabifermentans]|uniref:Membrane protein n=1 Tax=Lactiplantibacillus fabifermentans T30PCM01 TaxID=1400520 RepID=W6T801_9LACO|nr:YfhO family protein [Lactiplantibacillus fabifermentans]ETY74496.1 membrane protein [Lactiplantibacillus fabifermentans T30PCM01]
MKIRRIFDKQTWPLWISFWLPLLIMTGYFIYRHMAPFGSSSLLTVDLGQQYVDLFAYFRHTLLHDPSAFFYSFSKTIGGEMVGVWAYYLMSPFNLIYLLFPGTSITTGIFIVTVLKYGCAGWAFGWLLTKTKTQSGWLVPVFSTAYAMMGWMIANQLNMIWLDTTAILPLVILGLERLFTTGKVRWFAGWLAVMLIDNYYMGYMVVIFACLYWVYGATKYWENFKTFWIHVGKFAWGGFLAFCLSAWLLLPTIWALSQSKAQYNVTKIHWKLEYAPWKMLAKFVTGTFNFNQMPSGQPNFYIAWIAILGFILFFLRRRPKWPVKVSALIVTGVLLLSFCYEPLDLLWHAGQFPVWYPYRFSFVFCFWIVWIGAQALTEKLTIKWWQGVVMLVILTGIFGTVYLNLKHVSYVTTANLAITIGLAGVSLVLLLVPKRNALIYQIIALLLVAVDMTTYAVSSLNNISYVSQSEFGNYTSILDKTVKKIQSSNSGFYRIGKTFTRTKDDPMQASYNGADHFSSTFESIIPNFFGSIGQPDGDGVVTYTNGTLITDSLLDMQYFMDKKVPTAQQNNANYNSYIPVTSTRTDLVNYKKSSKLSNSKVTTYKNPYALGLGFAASDKITKLKVSKTTGDPIARQELIYQTLANRSTSGLISAQNFDEVIFQNVKKVTTLTGSVVNKQNLAKTGSIYFKFTPKTNDSYYITLGANLSSANASYYINGKELKQYPTYRHTIAVNVASHAKGKTITFGIQMKKTSLWLQNFTLYKLNNTQFKKSATKLQQSPWNITKHSSRKITGTINIKQKHQVLMTTIPYSKGWHATVDGKAVSTKKVINTFVAVPLSKGKHTVTLTYRPPFMVTGSIITGVAALGTVGWFVVKRRRRQDA